MKCGSKEGFLVLEKNISFDFGVSCKERSCSTRLEVDAASSLAKKTSRYQYQVGCRTVHSSQIPLPAVESIFHRCTESWRTSANSIGSRVSWKGPNAWKSLHADLTSADWMLRRHTHSIFESLFITTLFPRSSPRRSTPLHKRHRVTLRQTFVFMLISF